MGFPHTFRPRMEHGTGRQHRVLRILRSGSVTLNQDTANASFTSDLLDALEVSAGEGGIVLQAEGVLIESGIDGGSVTPVSLQFDHQFKGGIYVDAGWRSRFLHPGRTCLACSRRLFCRHLHRDAWGSKCGCRQSTAGHLEPGTDPGAKRAPGIPDPFRRQYHHDNQRAARSEGGQPLRRWKAGAGHGELPWRQVTRLRRRDAQGSDDIAAGICRDALPADSESRRTVQ